MANLGNLPLSYRPVRRFSALYAGLICYGTGMSLMLAAKLGLDPWDVFHQGLARITHLAFGTVVIVLGVLILLLWIPLRQMPGIGTISNAIVIGLVVSAVNAILPIPHALALRWVYALGGIVVLGIGSGLYIGARLGPGPRDGLMTGVVSRFGGRRFVSIRVVRTAIEATVLLIGFLMGGQVGWITLIFAVTIGPIVHVVIPMLTVKDPTPAAPQAEPSPQAELSQPAPLPPAELSPQAELSLPAELSPCALGSATAEQAPAA